eukprot:CAMPEP_0117486350 /NCGR_PEP_ID=MMETSP0784-20121206/15431_1 /TAXON_ID=39447 /ORGANISM="" /LENGTH=220 /DNA_ID=CAMNT_0005280957 /DNA_START=20 /DNA_END=679 /DNA_ORIENTATION=+
MAPLTPASMIGTRRQQSGRALLAVGLLACVALRFMARPAEAWAGPAPTSRRAAAAVSAASILSASGFPPAYAAPASKPGSVRIPGQNDEVDYNIGKDPPEVVKARTEARLKAQVRMAELKETFRGWFTEFSKDGATKEERVEQLEKMTNLVNEEKMLPIGITRQDITKGVRSVKFNLGCVKDKVKKDPECKPIEKAYLKLLNTVDKVYEKNQDVEAAGRA